MERTESKLLVFPARTVLFLLNKFVFLPILTLSTRVNIALVYYQKTTNSVYIELTSAPLLQTIILNSLKRYCTASIQSYYKAKNPRTTLLKKNIVCNSNCTFILTPPKYPKEPTIVNAYLKKLSINSTFNIVSTKETKKMSKVKKNLYSTP